MNSATKSLQGAAVFQTIGKAVELKVAAVGLTKSLQAAMILAKVNEVGAGRWQATRFRNGRLTLVADSPIAAQELKLRRTAIFEEITQALGEGVVKEVGFRS